ncbi:hypothetical protein LZ31DRAFT_160939 [Colletotrichum somersetense]|nr:hypothetical protein LZ31DRAFT_160939 [Colletotrichum somersetense]
MHNLGGWVLLLPCYSLLFNMNGNYKSPSIYPRINLHRARPAVHQGMRQSLSREHKIKAIARHCEISYKYCPMDKIINMVESLYR